MVIIYMNIRDDFLYYSRPYITEDAISRVEAVLRSGWWTSAKEVKEFESRFAEAVGAKYAVAVNSCTAALELSLYGLGIKAGDEVITTPMTFCSTVHSIVRCGATPVFADIDANTGLIDVKEIEKKINSRTKAILPVHYAGQACNMNAIKDLANKHSLFVIEDAAHAFGTEYDGKPIGSMGYPTAFSFYVTKNLATGEGGMLTTNDKDFADLARKLSLHGMNRDAWNRYGSHGSWFYEVDECGFKFNMPDILATIGLSQMDHFAEMQEARLKFADYYRQRIDEIKGVDYLKTAPLSNNAEHLFVIKIGEELSIDRDEFIKQLTDYKIGTSVHFIPVHLHPYYKNTLGTKQGDYPNCEAFFNQIISIPLYPSMTFEDVKYVADAIEEIAAKHSK